MDFQVIDLGLVEYSAAWGFQKEACARVKSGALESVLVVCRHYPVITSGRLADKKNILASLPVLQAKGVRSFEVERGGDVTYHGPGQLTVYPIFNLELFKKDLHFFLRRLEEAVMECLSGCGVKSQRRAGRTGVWVKEKKICSIGIAVKNWITFHGLSLNISGDDLDNFGLIRPCGMDIEMTSLEQVLGEKIEINLVKIRLISAFAAVFNRQERLCMEVGR